MRPNALESQKFLWKTPVLNDKHSLLVLTPILWLAPNSTELLAVVQLSDFHTSSVVYACISWWAAGLFSSAFRASAREIKSPEQAYSLQEQHSFQPHTSPSPCLWRARILKETKGQFIRKKVRTLGHLTHLFRARSMFYLTSYTPVEDFSGGSVVKNPPARQETWVRSLGWTNAEGTGNLLKYSLLGNPMDRRAWRATVHGVSKSQIWLSIHTHTPLGIVAGCGILSVLLEWIISIVSPGKIIEELVLPLPPLQ